MKIFPTTLLLLGLVAAQARDFDMGTPEQIEAGKNLYLVKCAQCHGDNGDGKGPGAANLNPPPRDFTMAIYKIKTTANGRLATTQDLKDIILKGVPYTSMPGWPMLSDEQITNLAYYIKSFADEDYRDEELIGEPLEFIKIPEGSDAASLDRGKKLYEENKCSDCHGLHGYGDGPSGPDLADNNNNPMRAADLSKPWTWRGGGSKQDILRTLLTGIEGTPMPSLAESFKNDQEKVDLVNYVYSLASSREPNYQTVLVAKGSRAPTLDLNDPNLFAGAKVAHFPLFTQIVEPGRRFNSNINSVNAQAVYNDSSIALKLTWHDMKTDSGTNSPDIPVPLGTPNIERLEEKFSDAVAIQFPAAPLKGIAKPYFIFGDKKNATEIWFADLYPKKIRAYLGKGSGRLNPKEVPLEFSAYFEDGVWTALFKGPRISSEGFNFKEDSFAPVAFSVWNGMRFERGNKRTLTRWFDMYLEPRDLPSPIVPALKTFFLILIFEIVFLTLYRAFKRA